MQNLKAQLHILFTQAIKTAFKIEEANPLIQNTARPEFGQYQANFALSLAKAQAQKPREVAEAVLSHLRQNNLIEQCDISGPGFINIHLKAQALETYLHQMMKNDRLGIEKKTKKEIVVVDYSSANVAKEMHIGHIRSTVIGDAIVRILDFLGDTVIKQNHIGDWGTQFGMLIEYLLLQPHHADTLYNISDLNTLYREAKQHFDADPAFKLQAQQRVVALQSGDLQSIQIWQEIVSKSLSYFQTIYARLSVLLTQADCCGESFYNPFLKDLVDELLHKKIATHNEGACVIFLPGFFDQNNQPFPFMIQKSDGGYLYATTDLAAAHYRINTLKANRIIYVVDARQKQHFNMLFAAIEKAKWSTQTHFEHIAFGSILGKDQKPFKTRSGETIKLSTLIDEAIDRAYHLAKNKNPDLSETDLQSIAQTVGVGALKYADLSTDHIKDYIFDWDKMISFEGNTAPYLINAYVRIQSLFRKNTHPLEIITASKIRINDPNEKQLAFQLSEFSVVLESLGEDLALHRLCHYLYQLAAHYHRFYELCPILSAPEASTQLSRLQLSLLTAKTLKLGLSLLGIDTVEKM
jgi:arginyl-tRNA synthetase